MAHRIGPPAAAVVFRLARRWMNEPSATEARVLRGRGTTAEQAIVAERDLVAQRGERALVARRDAVVEPAAEAGTRVAAGLAAVAGRASLGGVVVDMVEAAAVRP